ncbi:hypothetical protein A2Y99_00470 [Candidatus Gottesmanbacteria bacterium RBG_13_37_7]|uniref:DUF1232 domain-containing protein n=1 Tax=Candidatus Gottesmanbacteria bacterium RBG_13_37_7 TaxID=1798369 RepID=A0A1F5YJU7_9BACT|nr:MAG: hypothetical protein A2Y99_00470 [Candidatus Gottesmanbacteria bacterium RBG_13_37_7]
MNTSFIRKFLPYLIISLGVVYGVWPMDLIPDVPVAGWIDDIGVIGATLLIAFILYFKNKNINSKGIN